MPDKKKISASETNPTAWFEELYANANIDGIGVPWAKLKPHPRFSHWLSENALVGTSKSALVVGCGMGDDAIELERLGFDVTAFDVSDSAIKLCKERFPESSVNFMQADLFKSQSQWLNKFDFVLEIFTLQALPPIYEDQLIKIISSFVKKDGTLLVIADVKNQKRDFENGPPWMLTPEHVEKFILSGFKLINQVKLYENAHDGELDVYTSALKKII